MKTRVKFLFGLVCLLPCAAMASGTVNNCTEADLLAAMAGGGTVTFACSGTIVLSQTLIVDQDTTFLANGQDVTISGDNLVRILQVNPNVSCFLSGIKLIQGRHVGSTGGAATNPAPPGGPGQGGGILNLGTVSLSDCLLAEHYVEGGFGGNSKYPAQGGDGMGGAICNLGGSVRLTNCVFRGNEVLGGMGSSDPFASQGGGNAGHGLGGAIYSAGGTIYLSAVLLSTNLAAGGESSIALIGTYTRGGDARGGALYAIDSSLVIEDSMLLENRAQGRSLPFSGAGAGWASGGALFLTNTLPSMVSRSTFAGNTCQAGGSPRFARAGTAAGGAIFSSGPLTVIASTFSTNSGAGGNSITTGPALGGAIYSGSACILTESTFDHNRVIGGRGPSVSLGGWPGTNGAGGAVWSRGTFNATNCTFAFNRAEGGDSAAPNGNPATPGGNATGGGLHFEAGTAQLVNLTVASNETEAGGSDWDAPPTGVALGGGVDNASGSLTLRNTILSANTAANVSGTVTDAGYNLSSDATPPFSATGSINGVDPQLGPLASNGGPTATMALDAGSPAINIIPSGAPPTDQRGIIRPQGPASDAGAFEVVATSQSGVVNECTEAALRAAMAGGGTVTFACSGTIVLAQTLVVDHHTTLLANGHDVTISGNASVRILQVNTDIICNIVGIKLTQGRQIGRTGTDVTPPTNGETAQGAAILNLGGEVILSDCLLADHYVQGGAGGNSTLHLLGGDGRGAAICNLAGSVRLTNCVLQGNAARGGMGGTDGSVSVGGGNAGHGWGGAIYSAGGSIYMSAVLISTNLARGGEPGNGVLPGTYTSPGGGGGGAFYVAESVLTIEDSRFLGNTAVGESLAFTGGGGGFGSGGALFLTNGIRTAITRSTFVGNTTRGGGSPRFAVGGTGAGGAIYSLSSMNVSACTFSTNSCEGGESTTTGPGLGGAIYSGVACFLVDSTFDHNSATGARGPSVSSGGWPGAKGAGGAVWSSDLLNATNCTFAFNRAVGGQSAPPFGNPESPGGAGLGGAIHIEAGTANLVNLTVAQNGVMAGASVDMGPPTGPALGGGIYNSNGVVTLRGTILADNTPTNFVGTMSDGGYNLSSDATPLFSTAGSLNGVNPQLGPLASNGGPTATMALAATSPAIDIILAGAPPTDQRGEIRPQGPASDAGAFEVVVSRIVLFVEIADHDLVITFDGVAGRSYRLHGSDDLRQWAPLASKTAVNSGPVQFTLPATGALPSFFKVSSP